MFNVQDESSVRAWKARAEALNQKAQQLINESMNALNEFKVTAEGQIFEKVVEYSNKVIVGMTKVLEGMNMILDVVSNIVNEVKNKIADIVEDVGGVMKRIVTS